MHHSPIAIFSQYALQKMVWAPETTFQESRIQCWCKDCQTAGQVNGCTHSNDVLPFFSSHLGSISPAHSSLRPTSQPLVFFWAQVTLLAAASDTPPSSSPVQLPIAASLRLGCSETIFGSEKFPHANLRDLSARPPLADETPAPRSARAAQWWRPPHPRCSGPASSSPRGVRAERPQFCGFKLSNLMRIGGNLAKALDASTKMWQKCDHDGIENIMTDGDLI